MALLRALFSILFFSHLVLDSEMLNYLEQQVSYLNDNISHDYGLIQPHKSCDGSMPVPLYKSILT